MEKYSLSIKKLTKSFKKQVILENINEDFYSGNIYGIIGQNGSGKTLLFKIICGFVQPTEGEIFVYGNKLSDNNCFPKETGIVIEKSGLIENYSAYQNLKYLTGLNKNVDNNTIYSILIKMGLDPNDKKMYKNFSLGMKQKLIIAQAILENPKILILDEPFNSLDEDSITKVKNIILEYRKDGKLIFLATHNSADIDELCDKKFQIYNKNLISI